jgi:hypothetical protein
MSDDDPSPLGSGSEGSDTDNAPTPYGKQGYWDDRYGTWAQDPFDWLFSYKHLAHIIGAFFDHKERLLIPGCGNAPFSPDLYEAGYTTQVNIDTSTVVIGQQIERHKDKMGCVWEVGDCMAMDHESESFDSAIDKSLVDTLMCAPDSAQCVHGFLSDMSRCVKPGGFIMLLSLHGKDELLECIMPEHAEKPNSFADCDGTDSPFNWTVSSIEAPNPNRDPESSAVYTIAICRKHDPSRGFTGGARQQVALQAALEECVAIPQRTMSKLLSGISACTKAKLITHDEKADIKELLLKYETINDFCRMSEHIHDLVITRKEKRALEGDPSDFDYDGQFHVESGDFFKCAAVRALDLLLAEDEE